MYSLINISLQTKQRIVSAKPNNLFHIKLNSFLLTLRRPMRQLFFSSHGSALTAIPKRWKNIPHKSSTADFLKLFILMQGACGTDKTRLKILESDFTYYGVYSFWTFCVCLNFFLFNHSKTSFKTFIVILNLIWFILNHLFGYFLEYLAKFEVWSGIEKTRDSSFYVTHPLHAP